MERRAPARHSVLGWFLMVTAVAVPGVLAVVAAINPYFGWVSPNGIDALPRLVTGVVGGLLCANAFGFLLYRSWSWWITAVWGGVSLVEALRYMVESPAFVSILAPQVMAVGLLIYVWRRREDFGVVFGGPRP
ncbi:MAG: hypothetical protein R3195_07590 [Gemmatimonadota bacterium]|nr:hypothetical protein [Gemmatimonadota bacterium]